MVYIYETSPQDWWEEYGWKKITKDEVEVYFPHFEVLLKENTSWEGDFAQGPYLSSQPIGESEPSYVVGVKQANNGSTYYLSYLPLSHIPKEHEVATLELDCYCESCER